jgi:virginiamycin B lyase
MTWRCGLALALTLAIAGAPTAFAAPAGTTTTFPLPAQSSPAEAVAGPDGNIWITLSSGISNGIARMTPGGTVTVFTIPTANAVPNQITAGPDGALWFGEFGQNQIGRVTTAGQFSEFPLPNFRAQGMTPGPDGNVWFNTSTGGQIGRITPAGAVTLFPTPGGAATDLTFGPDGNIWYTAQSTNRIGRMTTAGAAVEFTVTGAPGAIAAGPDGALWFTQTTGSGRIGRMAIDGTVTNFQVPTASAATNAIVPGPDGNLWFTESAAGKIGRITTAGQVVEFDLGVTPLAGLGTGPDGALWVPEPQAAQMARVDAGAPDPVLGKSFAATPVSGTVLVRLPGTSTFVRLDAVKSLPLGTIVDARKGVVRLTATSGGKTYFADFYEGIFQIAQLARKGSTADLKLFGGSFKGCPKAPRASGAATRKKKSIRHLWGKGSGPFRTVGRFSAATVRGTTWLTDDQCGGTLTKVTAGSVSVRDFVKRKTVVVRRGKSYLAAARRR